MKMLDLFEAIENFDARTAEPHFCESLLRMEEERYVQIRNGKIVPTGKLEQVSPEAIFNHSTPVWECNLAKAILTLEAEGKLTIQDGEIALTDKSQQEQGQITKQ